MRQARRSTKVQDLAVTENIRTEEYTRQRIEPTAGDTAYLHLSDLLLGLKMLMPSNITRILDYGCGGSPYRRLFGACTYHRSDLPGDLPIDFEYGPDSRLPAELADYDCVLSSQVLEHVLSPTSYLGDEVTAGTDNSLPGSYSTFGIIPSLIAPVAISRCASAAVRVGMSLASLPFTPSTSVSRMSFSAPSAAATSPAATSALML